MSAAEPPRTLGRLVQACVTPDASLATDDRLLRVIASPNTTGHFGFFRVYAISGDVVSVGRYHTVPRTWPRAGAVAAYRRRSGGRNLPFGDGFVGLSLILPHRSALVSDDPLALAPHQVMNRCVRGLLEALKLVGIPAFYPGLDLVTVDRRALAAMSFEVTPSGGLLFEAIIARSKDFSAMDDLLARSGAPAELRGPGWRADDVTSIKRQLGVELSLEEVAALFERGYAQQFNLAFGERDTDASGGREPVGDEATRAQAWLLSRMRPSTVERHAASTTLLGTFEAYVSVRSTGAIDRAMLAGDFIANSDAIDQLEADLRGCPFERTPIDAVVARTFAKRENFILGIGQVSAITDLLLSTSGVAARGGSSAK